MEERKHVVLSGRSKAALDALSRQLVGRDDLHCTVNQIINGHTDPLYGVDALPDTLVLRLTPNSVEELVALTKRPANERPPLIVIGDSHDAQAMRLAMQAGARDILSEPINQAELLAALERIWSEARVVAAPARTRSFAFINTKGGSGATFIAANVAHILAAAKRQETLIVDLDVQFGTLPHYLDVQPKRGLLEALSAARELDEVAIEAYLARHVSGLRVLARAAQGSGAPIDPGIESFSLVLDMLKARCQRIVFDVPRHLDSMSAVALERVDGIVMVMQQTIPSLRDATRLNEILRDELGIPSERIRVLINRFRKGTSVEINDIRRLLHDADPFIVPNHFGPVSESIDSGVPIYDHARSSPVARALVEIATELDGQPITVQRNFVTRTIGSFLRS